jgi:hypothetical protein
MSTLRFDAHYRRKLGLACTDIARAAATADLCDQPPGFVLQESVTTPQPEFASLTSLSHAGTMRFCPRGLGPEAAKDLLGRSSGHV